MGPDSPRPRLFYLLPKIHKAPASWPVPGVIPSGRPIVSDCGSETYNVAEFIDYYLNPLSRQHPSYIKDTYDFVNKLKTIRAPKHTLIFSIDVESLYTNIDTDLGLKAVADVLNTKPDPSRPDHFILELLELTLRRNDFEFDGKHFLQISGCAMGRKYSLAYADIYMADWEKSAFQKCSKLPLLYLRYLDDIFGLWPHSLSDFKEFIKTLNNHHPKISNFNTIYNNLRWNSWTHRFFSPILTVKPRASPRRCILRRQTGMRYCLRLAIIPVIHIEA